MKRIIFPALLVLVCNSISFAQCDKNFVINSSKTEYLAVDSSIENTVDETTEIDITRPQITITPNGRKMSGTITSETCNWKTPFIEGTTVLKATFKSEQGDVRNATITIQGKDSKLKLWLSTEEDPTMIRVAIDKFVQKN